MMIPQNDCILEFRNVNQLSPDPSQVRNIWDILLVVAYFAEEDINNTLIEFFKQNCIWDR